MIALTNPLWVRRGSRRRILRPYSFRKRPITDSDI